MDREEEEMQFVGLFGVYKEAYNILVSCRKIFSKITLTLIFPLCFIFLGHKQVSDILLSKIIKNENNLMETQQGTHKYYKLSNLLSSEWTTFWVIKAAYFTFLLIFGLLSTSAVVYTVASVYTAREVSFKKVMSVVPKVWKRVMVTFLWTFIAFFVYNIVAFIFLVVAIMVCSTKTGPFIIGVLYLGGFVYLTIVWQLASVVSVLEQGRGIEAMNKSRALIKGKMWLAFLVFVFLILAAFGIEVVFRNLVIHGWSFNIVGRFVFGVICFLLLTNLFLFGLVTQTVLYFVCKSYHHESIDKSALSDHLQVYLGEYVPLKSRDVQLQQFQEWRYDQ